MADPESSQMIIKVQWHMHFACWITKATDTHTEYVTLVFNCNSGFMNVPQIYVTYTVSHKHISKISLFH